MRNWEKRLQLWRIQRRTRWPGALAEKFTVCDAYHCSVIGPTDPNRLMSMSAWIDPYGTEPVSGKFDNVLTG